MILIENSGIKNEGRQRNNVKKSTKLLNTWVYKPHLWCWHRTCRMRRNRITLSLVHFFRKRSLRLINHSFF